MSYSRSPRAVRSMTIGTRGIALTLAGAAPPPFAVGERRSPRRHAQGVTDDTTAADRGTVRDDVLRPGPRTDAGTDLLPRASHRTSPSVPGSVMMAGEGWPVTEPGAWGARQIAGRQGRTRSPCQPP